jgi:putative transposase
MTFKKKIMSKPVKERRLMIESKTVSLSKTTQCRLLNIHRSGLYYKPITESEENIQQMRLMNEQYMRTPFYGIRRMSAWLVEQGYSVNRKRVIRLMGLMGWHTIYRAPNTSLSNKEHKKHPYLLKGLQIDRQNQVWAMHITYVHMKRGFMYLCAIIDLHTRYVVNWSVSNTMTAEWCTEVVNEAIGWYDKPQTFNTDQGTQFTSDVFTQNLKSNDILISMDGKGRAIDNMFIERLWRTVKYENIYLNNYEDGVSLYKGLVGYFDFYNQERLHQSLGYQNPKSLFQVSDKLIDLQHNYSQHQLTNFDEILS